MALKVRCNDARNSTASFVRIVLASWETGPRISTPATGDTAMSSANVSHDQALLFLIVLVVVLLWMGFACL